MSNIEKVLSFIVISFLIYSCAEVIISKTNNKSSEEEVIFSALKAVHEKKYNEVNSNKLPDTIKIFRNAYLKGCYYYGLENFSFYYGFIDTISFPSLKLGKDALSYFYRIQTLSMDTIYLTKEYITVNGKKIHLEYFDTKNRKKHQNEFIHLTPLIEKDNNKYTFGLINMDKVLKAYLHKDSGVLKCDTIIYYDGGSNLNPCGVPDTLRNADFEKLFNK